MSWNSSSVKYASFFSGIEGFGAALDSAGFECVFRCELDEFCNKVLEARYGKASHCRDITKIKPKDIPEADLWGGGPPCQDLSVAGRRAGLGGRRSGLFYRFIGLLKAKRPRLVILEQVPGLFSSHEGRDMESWLGALAELGYVGSYWVVDAQFRGVPQRRRRVITVSGLGDSRCLEVFPFSEGCARHSSQGRKEGADSSGEPSGGAGVTGCLRHLGGGGPDDNEAQAGHLIAGCLGGGDNRCGRRSEDDPNLVAHAVQESQGHHGHSSPRGDGADNLVVGCLTPGGPDGRRKGWAPYNEADHLIAFGGNNTKGPIDVATARNAARSGNRSDFESETFVVAPSLRTNAYNNSDPTMESQMLVRAPIPFDTTQITSNKNYSNPRAGDPCHPLAAGAHPPAIIAAPITRGSSVDSNAPGRRREDDENIVIQEGQTEVREHNTVGTLRSEAPGHQPCGSLLRNRSTIRRLTPTECERLMGQPDGATCLCGVRPDCPDRRMPSWIDPSKIRLGGCGHSTCGCKCSDSARYRALGNSVVVPVVRWVAERLKVLFSE